MTHITAERLIEENGIELFQKHANKIIEVTKIMKETTNLYCTANDSVEFPKDKKTEVIKKERKANEIKQEIIKHLMNFNYPSQTKTDFMSILFACEEIAENSRAAVVKLSFLGICDPDEKVKTDIQEMTDYSVKIVELLKGAISDLLLGNFKGSIEKSNEIEDMEEKVDQLRRNRLTPKLVEWAATEKNPGVVGLLMDMVDNVEDAVDQAEKSANLIRKIAVRHI